MQLNRVRRTDDLVPLRNVIISTSDKTGLDGFIGDLVDVCRNVQLYSTGGTYSALEAFLGPERAVKHLRRISDYTGQPEMQGGLVKTLDYRIYLGLLSETYNSHHQEDIARTSSVAFDMLVVNLYPFQEAAARPGNGLEDARTHIDIGGPCMLRAGAKNFLRVAALCDPQDYPEILRELKTLGGSLSLATRFRLARKVFRLTADYDSGIAEYFMGIKEKASLEVYDTP
jgi:phosphoribosylaminoimidazolecarboxamide formyltransferase/IMP cyclohydrolase